MIKINLLKGDCLQQLTTLPSESIDSIVTDPPYGLDFMGKKWDYDVPSVDIWKECLRVLKPGGHLLAFFGTRTYHRGVVRIEDAGFEIRDQIMWIYGSGFPKSHNIGKAIDKAAGVEREVVGTKRKSDIRGSTVSGEWQGLHEPDKGIIDVEYTAPATDLAKKWDGWGTALKPANEPIVVARKPLEKGLTIAENVIKWGTGAINIDECRIEFTSDADAKAGRSERKTTSKGFQSFTEGEHDSLDRSDRSHITGRWPANILFDEEAAAVLDEQTKEKQPTSRFFKVINNKDNLCQDQNQNQDNANPAEKILDQEDQRLSSVLEVVKINFKKDPNLKAYLDYIPDSKKCSLIQNLAKHVEKPESIGTTEIIQSLLRLFGSALHVTDESINLENQSNKLGQTRFLYQAKASKSERNKGLEGMPTVKTNKMGSFGDQENFECPDGASRKGDKGSSSQQNFHPTVKPVKLMEYLIKLVTPPNGTVLDPFMGSGSTGVAARELGFNFIGCELSDEYFEIAKKRVENA